MRKCVINGWANIEAAARIPRIVFDCFDCNRNSNRSDKHSVYSVTIEVAMPVDDWDSGEQKGLTFSSWSNLNCWPSTWSGGDSDALELSFWLICCSWSLQLLLLLMLSCMSSFCTSNMIFSNELFLLSRPPPPFLMKWNGDSLLFSWISIQEPGGAVGRWRMVYEWFANGLRMVWTRCDTIVRWWSEDDETHIEIEWCM